MRNFQLIAANVDVMPLLHAVTRQSQLWNENRLRTTYPETPHAEASDIWLWFNSTDDAATVADDKDTVPYPARQALPQARPIVFDLMRGVQGSRLGRVLITRLAPGKSISPHADGGAPAEYFSRYQVALQSLPGCLFTIGDEVVTFSPGDVWWIANQRTHSVVNNSTDDRVVLIVDIRVAP